MTTTEVAGTAQTSGEGKRPPRKPPSRRTIIAAAAFLAPALILLGALVGYPVIYSIWRSLYDAAGTNFLGLGNYVKMFEDPTTFTAIKNNIIWVVVVPATVTIIGLIFAVLMDKVKWAIAFKLIVFMPMAISMVAAGVIFRTTFQENPQIGAANAGLVAIHDLFGSGADYPGARPRPKTESTAAKSGAVVSSSTVQTGDIQNFALIAVQAKDVPDSAKTAVAAQNPKSGTIGGTVWLDFIKGGGGTNGQMGDGKKGLPGIEVDAVSSGGDVVASTHTAANGTYSITGLDPGDYSITLPKSNFAAEYAGLSWLGPSLITAVVILSYIWIWAGFAMVMIASGLSTMDRSLQEAARIDGASEWQVFRRITAPLLSPVLIVVFVTLIINVLKIFDLVYVIPPASSLPDATVIAVQMWAVSFGGGNDQGLGSALAILLLLLVVPFMVINVRRFRLDREER